MWGELGEKSFVNAVQTEAERIYDVTTAPYTKTMNLQHSANTSFEVTNLQQLCQIRHV